MPCLYFEKHAAKGGAPKGEMGGWATSYAKGVYKKVVAKHLKIYLSKNRASQTSWETFYKNLQKAKLLKTGHEVVLVSDD